MEPKKFGGRGARARRQKVGCLAFGAWCILMSLIPIVLPINHSPAFLVAFLWLQLLCMDGGFWLWE